MVRGKTRIHREAYHDSEYESSTIYAEVIHSNGKCGAESVHWMIGLRPPEQDEKGQGVKKEPTLAKPARMGHPRALKSTRIAKYFAWRV
jgi:hypothetical protein